MKVKNNPKINAATDFLERYDLKVYPQTIRQGIKKNGYSSRTAIILWKSV